MVVVDVVDLRMVRFNVATESHPTELVVVYVYTPLEVYVLPFQVYMSQTLADEVDVVDLRMVRFNVATESHP